MRNISKWAAGLGMVLALLGPRSALADAPPTSVIIGDGVVSLGVSDNAGLAQSGLGLQFTATSADGLAPLCACSGWLLTLGTAPSAPTTQTPETFTFTGTTALSTVRVEDPTTGQQLRVTHDFHPTLGMPNLYEVRISVENLGTTTVQPNYARTLGWTAGPLDPSALLIDPLLGTLQLSPDGQGVQFGVALQPIEPGGVQIFRLYLGAGANPAQANAGLTLNGATLISQAQSDATTFVFGYASGAAPLVVAGGGGSNRGGGGGGGGGNRGSGPTGGPPASVTNPGPNVPVIIIGGAPITGTAPSITLITPPTTDTPSTDGKPTTDVVPNTHTGDGSPQGPTDHPKGPDIVPGPPTILGDDPIRIIDLTPQVAATPELDSLSLMASGLLGIGGYGFVRWRSRRKPGASQGLDAKGEDQQA